MLEPRRPLVAARPQPRLCRSPHFDSSLHFILLGANSVPPSSTPLHSTAKEGTLARCRRESRRRSPGVVRQSVGLARTETESGLSRPRLERDGDGAVLTAQPAAIVLKRSLFLASLSPGHSDASPFPSKLEVELSPTRVM